jgi:glycine cleavage system H protein
VNPADLKYSKSHEWVGMKTDADGRSIAVVGVSAFALEALTDLVFLALPRPGRALKAGETFGEIESVKAVSDLYSPVTGEVIAVHDELANKLDQLKADPYGFGWMIEVRLDPGSAPSGLMSLTEYEKQCAEEGH